MSNETTKNVDMTEIPEKLPDGTYEPVLTKKDLRRVARRWYINISTYSYTYQEAARSSTRPGPRSRRSTAVTRRA